jgi:hypothetical protein
LFDFNKDERIHFQPWILLINEHNRIIFQPHNNTEEGLYFGAHKLDPLHMKVTVLLARSIAVN